MGYLSDNLKVLLGGKDLDEKSNSVVKNWTPNNVKALVIGRGYILVVHHVGAFNSKVKVISLDEEKLTQDINEILRKGSSNVMRVLKRRSLSCLEEIYFDNLYRNEEIIRFINLEDYVADLGNSRLRFFGYGNFGNQMSAVKIREQFTQEGVEPDFNLAEGKNDFNIIFKAIGNNKWYSSYYLRPQYYALDSANGKLSMHFKKFEDTYEKYVLGRMKNNLGKAKLVALSKLVSNVDTEMIGKLSKLRYMLKSGYVKGSEVEKIAYSSFISSCELYSKIVPGLTEKYFEENRSNINVVIADWCRTLWVFDKEENDRVMIDFSLSNPIVDVDFLIDIYSFRVSRNLASSGYEDLVNTTVNLNRNSIPQGQLSELFNIRGNSGRSTLGLFVYIGELLGLKI